MTLPIPNPALDIRPMTPVTNDGNRWVTGECWFFCRRAGVRVLWVGPATTPHGHADVFACEFCMNELAHKAQKQLRERDQRELVAR